MKPTRFTSKDVKEIDLGNKLILKYPTISDNYDIAHMIVKGKFPENNKFTQNDVCDFFIYVLRGKGTVYAGDETYSVSAKDVVFVPAKNRYAVEGNFEYITIDVPAFYDSQAKIIA